MSRRAFLHASHQSSRVNSISPSSSVQRESTDQVEIDAQRSVSSVSFLADGKHIVCGSPDGKIKRWGVEDGKEVGTPMNAGSHIFDISVSQDGKWIVDGTYTGLVTVWNGESFEKTTEFAAHNRSVYAVDVSPDGTKVVTGSNDQTVRVWSLSTGQRLLNPLKHVYTVVAVKFSPDGQRFATATRNCESVRVYDCRDGRLLVDFPVEVRSLYNQSLVWAKSSRHIYALSSDGSINYLDVTLGNITSKWSIHHNNDPQCIALASNGTVIAASSGSSVSFWDTATQKQIGSSIQHTDAISSMAFSASGHLVIGGGNKMIVQIIPEALPPPPPPPPAPSTQLTLPAPPTRLALTAPPSPHSDDLYYMVSPLQESPPPAKADPEVGDPKETIKLLRAHAERSNDEIDHLKKAVQDLQEDLTTSRRSSSQKEDKKIIQSLAKTVQQLRQEKDALIHIVRAHEQKHHCETKYANGRTVEASLALTQFVDNMPEQARSNKLLMDWVSEFTDRCVVKLEIIGDDAMRAEKYGEAATAYTNLLSLGPSDPDEVLFKWANAMTIRGSVNEALRVANKFKFPRFLVYRAICDVLEQDGRITESIACYRQMQSELGPDTSIHGERAQWEREFEQRCAGQLEKLGDAAMDARNYNKAADHYMGGMSLEDVDQTKILIKWSKAQAMMNA